MGEGKDIIIGQDCWCSVVVAMSFTHKKEKY